MWIIQFTHVFFIKKSETGLTIIAVHVDDLNLIGTLEELTKNNQLFKEGIWNEIFVENKILSRPVDRALFKWHISPSIDIYRESIKMILYNHIHSIPPWLFVHLKWTKTYFILNKKMKNYLVKKYHILVQ